MRFRYAKVVLGTGLPQANRHGRYAPLAFPRGLGDKIGLTPILPFRGNKSPETN